MNAPAPDWMLASPQRIDRALRVIQQRCTGGWFVIELSETMRVTPRHYEVDGHELVLWRSEGQLVASPAACPHMGANLATGRVCEGKLVCPWHGLALSARGTASWRPYPVYDDGQLIWVRLPHEGKPSAQPIRALRPARCIVAGHRFELACDPEDVIANRLDPWHGAHLHPHSFSQLAVVDSDDDAFDLDVQVKVAWTMTVRARVRFHCPTARSIVMTIVEGLGQGSVLETHATPLGPGRTCVLETIAATSEHPLFRPVLASRLLGQFMQRRLVARAKRLWVEDAEYAERRCALRQRGVRTRLPLASREGAAHGARST